MVSFMRLILVLAGAASLAVAVNGVPAMCLFILPWLSPPYLHLVFHCIIIVIAAASCFGRARSAPPVRSQNLISVRTPPPAYYVAYSSSPEVSAAAAAHESEDRVVDAEGDVSEDDGERALEGRTLTCNNPRPEMYPSELRLEYFPPASPSGMIRERERVVQNWREKRSGGTSRAPLEAVQQGRAPRHAPDHFRYSMRKSKSFRERTIYIDSFSSHASSVIRKNASRSRNELNRRVGFQGVPVDRSVSHKSLSLESFSPEFQTDYLSPENQYENISQTGDEEEEYETMESAWKKITEENPHVGSLQPSPDRVRDKVAKSRSLKERAASPGMERELSSEEELNRRVEAFIKKVNEEIRLCRKKSLDQYIQLNTAA